jgi:hypothetical protein
MNANAAALNELRKLHLSRVLLKDVEPAILVAALLTLAEVVVGVARGTRPPPPIDVDATDIVLIMLGRCSEAYLATPEASPEALSGVNLSQAAALELEREAAATPGRETAMADALTANTILAAMQSSAGLAGQQPSA